MLLQHTTRGPPLSRSQVHCQPTRISGGHPSPASPSGKQSLLQRQRQPRRATIQRSCTAQRACASVTPWQGPVRYSAYNVGGWPAAKVRCRPQMLAGACSTTCDAAQSMAHGTTFEETSFVVDRLNDSGSDVCLVLGSQRVGCFDKCPHRMYVTPIQMLITPTSSDLSFASEYSFTIATFSVSSN